LLSFLLINAHPICILFIIEITIAFNEAYHSAIPFWLVMYNGDT
jgi:hypothetical protein